VIHFTDLHWAESEISSSDEFLELYNNSNQTFNLNGMQLTKNTGTETLMLEIDDPNAV